MKKFLIILFISHVLNFQIYSGSLLYSKQLEIFDSLSELVSENSKPIDTYKDLKNIVEEKVKEGTLKELDLEAINNFLKSKTKFEKFIDFLKKIFGFKTSKFQEYLSKLEKNIKSQIDEISKGIKSDLETGDLRHIGSYEYDINNYIKNPFIKELIETTGITKGVENQLGKLKSLRTIYEKINKTLIEEGLGDFKLELHPLNSFGYIKEDNYSLEKIRKIKELINGLSKEDRKIIEGTELYQKLEVMKLKSVGNEIRSSEVESKVDPHEGDDDF